MRQDHDGRPACLGTELQISDPDPDNDLGDVAKKGSSREESWKALVFHGFIWTPIDACIAHRTDRGSSYTRSLVIVNHRSTNLSPMRSVPNHLHEINMVHKPYHSLRYLDASAESEAIRSVHLKEHETIEHGT